MRKAIESKKIRFAAIEKRQIGVSNSQVSYKGGNVWYWGGNNDYPNAIYNIYLSSPTLQSVVDGIVQNVADSDMPEIDKIAFQLTLYGAFALRVGYNALGEPTFSVLDWRFLRYATNGNFVYSEKFGNYTEIEDRNEYTMLPFDENLSLFENKGRVLVGRKAAFQRYPIPPIGSALYAAESETLISRYHVAALEHGFAGNMLVNFNNGDAPDAVKAEIERDFIRKFNGVDNAAQIMFSWNQSKETQTEIQTIEVTDFGEKYKGLADTVRQQIFTAFRVNPNIFGLPTEGTGFAGEEYDKSFALFARNVIIPQRKLIADTLRKINIELIFNEIKPL